MTTDTAPIRTDGGQAATLTIGQIAARAGVNTSQIRYYEAVGVLPPAERIGGQRRYDEDVLRRLTIIDVAQRAGLTLQEIRELTGARPDGEDVGGRIRALAERRLPEIDALIARARAVRQWLQVASTCDCSTVDVCGLFVDPGLAPPPGDAKLVVRSVGPSAGRVS